MNKTVMKYTLGFAMLAMTSGLFATKAQAATVSQFHLAPGLNIATFTLTVVDASQTMLNFDPVGEQNINLSSQTGIFTGFNAGQLYNILDSDIALTSGPGGDVLIDLGTGSFPANGSTADGLNVFIATSTGPMSTAQSGSNVAIDFPLYGDFNIGGSLYQGAGNLTFQITNTTVGAVNSILANGGTLQGLTFSGALFNAEEGGGDLIPVPGAAASGLGLLFALMVRRRIQTGR